MLTFVISFSFSLRSAAMQEVSKLWKVGLTDDDRRYYNKVSI
jgi:hypothetical protein